MNPPETKPKKLTIFDVIKMIPKRADWYMDGDCMRTSTMNSCPISSIKDRDVDEYTDVCEELKIPKDVTSTIVGAADHSLETLTRAYGQDSTQYKTRKKLLKWLGLKDNSEKAVAK